MAFAEDMTAFFADFAVTASFTPKTGAAETAQVILDAPSDLILGGEMISTDYRITFPASSLPAIAAGNLGTVDGVDYIVREITLTGDGKIKVARLSRHGVIDS